MGAGQGAVDGVVLVQEGIDLEGAGNVAPVAHELADNVKVGDDVDASVAHAVVGRVADQLRRGARGFHVGPDAVTGLLEGEGQKCDACFFLFYMLVRH